MLLIADDWVTFMVVFVNDKKLSSANNIWERKGMEYMNIYISESIRESIWKSECNWRHDISRESAGVKST